MQLLHKLSIRSVKGSEKLLKVIKNPVTSHFPANTHKISESSVPDCHPPFSTVSCAPTYVYFALHVHGSFTALSFDSPVQRLSSYLPTVPANHSVAVFVGAMAHGADNFADGIVDEKISISEYSLSASVACGKVRKGCGEAILACVNNRANLY